MDKHLKKFEDNNPDIQIAEETEHYNITRMWGEESFMCRFKKQEKFNCLEHIYLPPELCAVYNKKLKEIEFIWGPIKETDPILNRKFSFYYQNIKFEASYCKPSLAIKLIAENIREQNPSRTDFRNLRRFKDYYKKDEIGGYTQRFMEDKALTVFKISGDFEKINLDFVSFGKNLNFYMTFYDRKSPYIQIWDKEEITERFKSPCYSSYEEFPETLNIQTLDPVLIDLFEVARTTSNTRLKFLFFFQILEYAAYYYLTTDFKRKLTSIIKRPDLLNKPHHYGKIIIDEYRESVKNTNDTVMLERLIIEHLDVDDIKIEITENIEYFKKELTFDGGFTIKPLISSLEDFDKKKEFLKTVKTNIENIRNVLVHIRESRENKVILPTNKNTHLLIPYLHLIQRVAEKITLQHEN